MADVGGAAFRTDDPRADSPRWIVADVLRVAAFEVGDPVVVFVLVEGNDFARRHFRRLPDWFFQGKQILSSGALRDSG